MNCLIFLLALLVIFESILGLDESCANNSDCSTTNAICMNDICACDSLSYNNGTQCMQYVTEYNSICYENEQCQWLHSNFECRHNRCVCQKSYRWYKGECQKYVDKGEACEHDDDCYNGYDLLSLTCSDDGVCECSSDYYDRGSDCRKTSFLTGECAIDLDCQSFLLQCSLGKCLTKGSIFAKQDVVEDEISSIDAEDNDIDFIYDDDPISCDKDDDCRDMANSLCDILNNTCGCNQNTHYLYNGNCIQGLEYCDTDTSCTDSFNNTMCFHNTCICQRGFFLKNGICTAELGMPDKYTSYESDSDCPIKPGKLVNSTCFCKNYWFNDEPNRNCIKTMVQSTNNCLTNEWCATMGPYSFCNSTTSTCQCSSLASFNEKTYYCDLISHTKDICLKDSECDINERCLDEQCACAENFSRNDDNICLPNIGASCEVSSCSHITNSYCRSGLCNCDNDYIGKETKCLKIADSLGGSCEIKEQCENLQHAICGESDTEWSTSSYNESLQCICDEGYTDVSNVCFQVKKFGDPCMSESECTLVLNRSYKCRNSICQCGVGQSLKNGYCTSTGSVLLASSLIWLALLVRTGLC